MGSGERMRIRGVETNRPKTSTFKTTKLMSLGMIGKREGAIRVMKCTAHVAQHSSLL